MLFGLLYLVSFFISIILIALLLKTSKTDISKRLIALTLLVSFWLLMETLSFFVSVEWILLFQKIKYIGVILESPTLLITAIIFIKKYTKLKFRDKVLIYLIPVLSLLSVLTEGFPYPFLTQPQIHFINDIPMYTYTKNIGFFINAIYSYILILATCYLLLIRAIQSPKIYRRQSMFVFLGCTMSFIINVLFITQTFVLINIDTTPIFVLFTLIVFYWGVYHLPKSMIVPYARDLVIENIKDLLFVLDNYDCIIDANPTALSFIQQYANQELKKTLTKIKLIGMNIYDLLKYIPQIKDLESLLDRKQDRILVLLDETKTRYYSITDEEIFDSDKLIIGKLYLLHDITQMKEQLNSLIKLNEELVISDIILNDALEGIVITNDKNVIIRVNGSMVKMSGFSKEELIGQNPRLLKSDYHDIFFYQEMWEQIKLNGSWEGEIWDKKKTGEMYPKWMSITTIYHPDGAIANFIGISSDITKMKKAEKDIQLLAYYDSLTGIPNRTLFYDRLKTALSRAKSNDSGVALFFMDIDRFKLINDSLGHDVGDQLLIEVSKRIQSIIRESDTLSRLSGDEFTLIIESPKCAEDAITVAENIINQINKPFLLLGREVTISISIGIAIAPYDDITLEGIIRKADSAMYHAKETGRGKYVFSSVEIERRNQEITEMQIRLKEALKNEEFMLYLQPQIAYKEGKYNIIGAEALIRWKSKGEIIPPIKFIPASEENGLILPIGNWIIKEIFRLDRVLKEQGIHIKLAINVSVKQFENMDLIILLKKMLAKNSSQDIKLIVEITESMFINDIDRAVNYLKEIKELGISIALDDFGTGFSSLSYLARLPVDCLKIDQSFVDKLDDVQHRKLTYSIITMAKTLNLKTLAEGVETQEQVDKLIANDCDELQGYFYCRPLPVDDFINFFKGWILNN
ncbi:MAG: EAL domain-containing protein [Mobilitalea sp.]